MPLPLRDHLKGGREEDAVLLEEVGGKPFPQGHGKLPEPSPCRGLDSLLELADLLVLVPQDPRWLHDPVLLHHGEEDVLLPQVVSLRLLEVLADVGQLLRASLPLSQAIELLGDAEELPVLGHEDPHRVPGRGRNLRIGERLLEQAQVQVTEPQ